MIRVVDWLVTAAMVAIGLLALRRKPRAPERAPDRSWVTTETIREDPWALRRKGA